MALRWSGRWSWTAAAAAAALMLDGGLGGGTAEAAIDTARCGPRQTLVRTDTRECKATKFRPAITIRRACCENAKGKVRCKPFKKCPRKSPSA